jgi:hypothetical protein
MTLLLLTFMLLAATPALVAVLFRGPMVERKRKVLREELANLRAFAPDSSDPRHPENIELQIERYYSLKSLLPPAVLLTLLYVPGFLLCYTLLNGRYGRHTWYPFYPELVAAAVPVLFTFVGAYVFNVSTTVRRLYLYDLTENVFWGDFNRLLFSCGIAIVFATFTPTDLSKLLTVSAVSSFNPLAVFFVIPFLANGFLQKLLESGLRSSRFSHSRRTGDLPLQTVRGIDLWKEYRFEEEGIETVQNLATADVLQLAIRTHYNLRTLIDWIDQSVLLSHLGDKVDTLVDSGLSCSAIDLAWQSPENTGNAEMAKLVADKIQMEPLFISATMNSLFEDAYVHHLWTLWQTRDEVSQHRARAVT